MKRDAMAAESRVLGVIAAGGAIGALARYGVATVGPRAPWSTLIINVTGCFLIGVLMVIVTRVTPRQRLLRPFVGVGILGGYTTFSTYVVDVVKATTPWVAFAYLGLTLVGALAAVWAGTELTSRLVRE